MATAKLVEGRPDITEEEVRHELDGNLRRCTGYENIVKAAKHAAGEMATSAFRTISRPSVSEELWLCSGQIGRGGPQRG